jgi:hypothetical protein
MSARQNACFMLLGVIAFNPLLISRAIAQERTAELNGSEKF